MKKIQLGNSGLQVSNIGLGCMSMANKTVQEAEQVIQTSLEQGINFFDHADIYGGGKSEEIFAKAIEGQPSLREKIVLQTKASIQKGYYDYSKEHIINAVDGSLKRLKTDYVDVFLLHRPDALMEPEEVAETFDELHTSGKVKHFGVSNHHMMQIELLKKYVKQELIVNQLQFSVMHTGMIDAGIYVNTNHENSVHRDGMLLEYCRLNNITIQAWSPFRYGFFEGLFIDNEKFPQLNQKLEEVGSKYGVSKSAIAVAWILRHPAQIQTLIGSMNPERIKEIAEASEVVITRQEWYEIYRAAGNNLP